MNLIGFVVSIIVLTIGLAGNTLLFIVFTTKQMKKQASSNVYRALAVIDSFYAMLRLSQSIFTTIGSSKNLFFEDEPKVLKISYVACKIFGYLNPAVGPISGHLLVFMSFERYFSIAKPKHFIFKFIKRKNVEKSIIITLFIFNFILYLPWLLQPYTTIDSSLNQTASKNNKTASCKYLDVNIQRIILSIDMLNLSILPFVLMFILSIMLIYTVIKARKRSMVLSDQQEKARLLKDIKFSVTLIFLNIAFVSFNLPISLSHIFEVENQNLNPYYSFVYMLSYCVNFYILVLTNSIFRAGLVNLFTNFKLYSAT